MTIPAVPFVAGSAASKVAAGAPPFAAGAAGGCPAPVSGRLFMDGQETPTSMTVTK